jgi:hypothetical protein
MPITGKTEAQIVIEYLSRNYFFRTKNTNKFPLTLSRFGQYRAAFFICT